jgi:outer membrane protein W
LRIGYQTWAVSNDSNDPFYIDGDEAIEVLSRPTVQPLLGARYFFTENIGVNLELGLGSPYVAMVGANFRF